MNTFMFLTFVLVFLLGSVTGAWLNADDSPFALKPDQKGRIWDVAAVMRSLLDGVTT